MDLLQFKILSHLKFYLKGNLEDVGAICLLIIDVSPLSHFHKLNSYQGRIKIRKRWQFGVTLDAGFVAAVDEPDSDSIAKWKTEC